MNGSPPIVLEAEALLKLRHCAARLGPLRLSANNLPGGMVNKRRGRGLEAADIRHFVPGDDVRLIDRNVTARTGELHVRTVHDERDQTALLMADFRPSMLWGTRRTFRSVAAAEMLALIGWQVVAAGGRVALLAFGAGAPVIVPPRGRDRGVVAVIGGLVRAHRQALEDAARGAMADPPLTDALTLARRMTPNGSTVWLASAFEATGEDYEKTLRALDERCPVTALRIADAFEMAAPDGLYPFATAGDDGLPRYGGMAAGAVPQEIAALQGWGIDAVAVDASVPPDRAGRLSEAAHV